MMAVWAGRYIGTVLLALVAAHPDEKGMGLVMLGAICCFFNAECDKAGL
jgi:presenilin-like A22 family membrane protease